jgi:hypothetical protein
MKKILYITLAAISLVSCKKDKLENNSDLIVTFQTKHDGANFGLNQAYRNPSNIDVKFELFHFYLSDFTLITKDGEERMVEEIALYRFNDNGTSTNTIRIPKDEFTGVKFGLGVKKELNEGDPALYNENNHPLSTTQNTYWDWTSMYRFIVLEGRYDEELDGAFTGTFAYHTGYEDTYKNLSFEYTFKSDKKNATALNFDIDFSMIIDATGNALDLPAEPFYHGGLGTIDRAERVSTNLMKAITLRAE